MERLKFYNIDNDYIDYLYQFDNKVPYNKNQKRPYIGIVIEVNNIHYFAPLFSPKKTHSKYSDNPTYMKIGKDYGIIRFNNMIPVVEEVLKPIDFNSIKDNKYKNLLIAQNNYIQQNTLKIRDVAEKLYKMVTIDKKDFFVNLSCNFKLLEEKVGVYDNSNNSKEETKFIKDVEITCEVFADKSAIVKALEDKEFKYVEEVTLDDIYMKNDKTNEFAPKNGRITDTLIIRYVSEDDKKIICKRRNYDSKGLEISTEKSVLKVESIEDAEKHLNILGYTRFLHIVDKNYMYENEEYIANIQEIKELGVFLELEAKNKETAIDILINYVKELNLNIGTDFNIRKAELLYKKQIAPKS